LAFWNWFAKGRDRPGDTSIHTGRLSQISNRWNKTLSPYRSRTADILGRLRRIRDEADAIVFLKKKTPDVGMAVWNFQRLSNQGHSMKFYAPGSDKELPEVEAEWNDFAARVNKISNKGLDGLIDILHGSGYVLGSQIIEVEINADRTDVVDVHPIDPRTIEWELEERDGQQVWIPYQYQDGRKVSLENANLFYCPTDPDIDDPRGNLIMAPALQSIDYQLQSLQDVSAVLRRQGYPRNDISIDMERLIQSLPQKIKSNNKELQDYLKGYWEQIRDTMASIEPTDDYLHYDDVTINMNQGANASRSLDIRAVQELIDVQVLSGLKQLGSLNNRINSHTETFSSVEFKIVVKGIESMQKGSKRLIEEIARLWLRVHGIQAKPVFTHNVVDWQSELDKIDVKLKQEEYWAIAQAMNWVDADYAAQQAVGVEKANGEMPVDFIRVSFNRGGDDSATDEHGESGLRQGPHKTLRSQLGIAKGANRKRNTC
jgi:hypothetical protein